MASVGVGLLLASGRSQPKLTLGFSQIPSSIPTLKFSPTFRCKGYKRLVWTVSATNPKSGSGKSDVKESSSGSQGPPLLFILAGFFLLFLIGWVIVSIVSCLIGFIVNVPPPK